MSSSINEVSTERIKLVNKYLENSRSKSLFVGSMTLLFLIIFVLFGILPGIQSIFSRLEENNKIDVQTQKAQKGIADFQKMQTESATDAELISKIQTFIPSDLAQTEVLLEINELVSNTNSYLQSITFSPDVSTTSINIDYGLLDQVRNSTVNISVESSNDGISRFLNSLETSKRIFSIDFVNIVKKSPEAIARDGFAREYSMNIQLKYFYWSQDF